MDQNQRKRPDVDSAITSPPTRPPFEKTSCECGDAKMEPTSAICPNTRMKICQCLARRKKLIFSPEAVHNNPTKTITTDREFFSPMAKVLVSSHNRSGSSWTGIHASWSGPLYFTANSFSNNSLDSLAPSSESRIDLFFVAGSEM